MQTFSLSLDGLNFLSNNQKLMIELSVKQPHFLLEVRFKTEKKTSLMVCSRAISLDQMDAAVHRATLLPTQQKLCKC